jgi:hypothetical protein
MKLRRFYSIQQIEFCRNFIFKRNFPSRATWGVMSFEALGLGKLT